MDSLDSLPGILCFYLAFAAMDRREWAKTGRGRAVWAGLLVLQLALTLAACQGLRLPWPSPLLDKLAQTMPLLAGGTVQ